MPDHQLLYRWGLAAVLAAAFGISAYFRFRADRIGGRVARTRDGVILHGLLVLTGVVALGTMLTWMIRPSAMTWTQLPMPSWLRLGGFGLSALTIVLMAWMFRHLGANVTPTATVRENAVLVTTGPYRWIRHPMYVFGTAMMLGLALISASWVLMAAAAATLLLIGVRTRREEANLAARFGEEFVRYTQRTGRFLPKLRRIT